MIERRVNRARRKRVSEMSPEEMREALLVSEKTGLPNSRAFDERERSPWVAMCDVNGLKTLNDQFGYSAGDTLISTYIRFYTLPAKRLRQRIGQALRGADLRDKLGHINGFEGSMGDKERAEEVRHLATEINDLVNKRGPMPVGDVLDALTSVMLTAIEATHGREKADEFDLLVARFSNKDATIYCVFG